VKCLSRGFKLSAGSILIRCEAAAPTTDLTHFTAQISEGGQNDPHIFRDGTKLNKFLGMSDIGGFRYTYFGKQAVSRL